jgi:hypothetical protein
LGVLCTEEKRPGVAGGRASGVQGRWFARERGALADSYAQTWGRGAVGVHQPEWHSVVEVLLAAAGQKVFNSNRQLGPCIRGIARNRLMREDGVGQDKTIGGHRSKWGC